MSLLFKPRMTPIYAVQRETVRQLLLTAELALVDAKEGRFNLDAETRRKLCHALDNINTTALLLDLQPLVEVEGGAT